jgi:hypothetical protein
MTAELLGFIILFTLPVAYIVFLGATHDIQAHCEKKKRERHHR